MIPLGSFSELTTRFLRWQIVKLSSLNDNQATICLEDINWEVKGEEWNKAYSRFMMSHGFNDVSFVFHEGNWVTIYRSEEVIKLVWEYNGRLDDIEYVKYV